MKKKKKKKMKNTSRWARALHHRVPICLKKGAGVRTTVLAFLIMADSGDWFS